jgi:hypothetical protein
MMKSREYADFHVPSLQESQNSIVEILANTKDTYLQADAEFEKVHSVVVGANKLYQLHFAEAVSNFLSQSDFDCLQPVYAKYFRHRYHVNKSLTVCKEEIPFTVLTRREGAKLIWLNPKRVTAIHLLFASKSNSMASRFGHVALRLVVCPEGKTSSEACESNLFEHIVVGYMAHIDEFSLNTLKALNGEYKSYLFASQFMDVYEGYAIGEFREIYSLPLIMSDSQRESIVRDLADVHWRYAGEYSFFSNNCSTMLQNALRITWPEYSTDENLTNIYLRPDSFYEALKTSPLADIDKIASQELAERQGYYFSSTRQFYDQALNEVRSKMESPRFTDLESYLQIDPIKRRQNRVTDDGYSKLLQSNTHLREAQMMLEEYAILSSERILMIEAAKYFEQQDFLAKSEQIRNQLDRQHGKVFDECLLVPLRQHSSPIKRLQGIPRKAEVQSEEAINASCHTLENMKLLREAIERIQGEDSLQWEKLKNISQYWADSVSNLISIKQM